MPAQLHKPQIVVVDDDPDQMDNLSELLAERGHSVIGFCSPLDAAAYLQGNACAALLSDVEMPGLSGIELARRVATSHPETQVMLMSGAPPCDAARDGPWLFFPKPVDVERLLQSIDQFR